MSLRPHHWLGAFITALFVHAAFAFALFYAPAPSEGAREKGANGLEISIQMVAAQVGAQAQEEVIEESEPVREPEPEPEEKVEEQEVPDPIDEEAVEEIVAPKPKKVEVKKREPLIKPKPPQTKPKPQVKPVAKKQAEPARKQITAVQSQGAANNAPKAVRTDRHNQSGGGQIVGQVIPSYKTTLGRWLAQYKTYPKKARRRNQEGVVHLTFTVNQQGRVTDYKVVKSSGHSALDDETIDMLERAQPLPKIPKELGVNSLTLTIPVQFALR